MKERASPGMQLFVGAGFWIVAWHLMPAPDWHLNVKIFVGLLTIVGALLVIGAIIQSARRVGPWWQGLPGRLMFVGLLWAGITAAAWGYGTPHLLYEYPPRQPWGTCLYLGWKGIVQIAASDGLWNGCAAISFIR